MEQTLTSLEVRSSGPGVITATVGELISLVHYPTGMSLRPNYYATGRVTKITGSGRVYVQLVNNCSIVIMNKHGESLAGVDSARYWRFDFLTVEAREAEKAKLVVARKAADLINKINKNPDMCREVHPEYGKIALNAVLDAIQKQLDEARAAVAEMA